jgi:uncharacterized membrane protein
MNTGIGLASLGSSLPVLLVGVLMCVNPLLVRPTVQFGVRIPDDRLGADVIRTARNGYYRGTALLTVGCTALTAVLAASASWVLPAVLLLELAGGVGCFLLARSRIAAVKQAERWYDGVRQTLTADTDWRTRPMRFPVLWAAPAVLVALGTLVVGIVRYPALPHRLAVHFTLGGRPDGWADKSLWSAFLPVGAQLLVTVLMVGLMLLTYRSRPDVDTADSGSTGNYRRFLAAITRALLVLAALVNVTLLLASLQVWQVWQLSGAASLLTLLPVLLGGLLVVVVAVRNGQAGSRLPALAPGSPYGPPLQPGTVPAPGVPASGVRTAHRDDDRYWKGGLVYVNRDDPALLVGKRFGVGWTFNLGNPKAWWLLAAIAAATAGSVLSAALGR